MRQTMHRDHHRLYQTLSVMPRSLSPLSPCLHSESSDVPTATSWAFVYNSYRVRRSIFCHCARHLRCEHGYQRSAPFDLSRHHARLVDIGLSSCVCVSVRVRWPPPSLAFAIGDVAMASRQIASTNVQASVKQVSKQVSNKCQTSVKQVSITCQTCPKTVSNKC